MKQVRIFSEIILLLLLHSFVLFGQNELTFISWNIKDFGGSRNDTEITNIAKLIRHADILAIQEVVAKDPGGAQAVARLVEQLERMGSDWDYRISDPTDSSTSYRSERYAFIWKTSSLSITAGGPYLITELSDQVEREPYLINFKVSGKTLCFINFHATTHTREFPERDEIQAISNWILGRNFNNMIWSGDMNLEITDEAFNKILQSEFSSCLNGQSTTLKMKCNNGNYLSLAEDNIIYRLPDFQVMAIRVIDFIAGGDCNAVEWKRDSYSDHFPVEMRLKLKN